VGQFDGLLPRLQYGGGPTNLDFTHPPFIQEGYSDALTLDSASPEADTGSTDEYVANHIYIFDFFELKCQHHSDDELDDFYDLWEAIRDGQQYTYFPDKDVGGTSFTVINAMKKFLPVRRDSLWYFPWTMRVIA
jgi:hypothetical protein